MHHPITFPANHSVKNTTQKVNGLTKIKPGTNLGQLTSNPAAVTFVQNLIEMKYKFVFALLFTVSFVFGQANYRMSNYSLVIKGTSNLHDWQSTAKEVRGTGSITMDAGALKSINSLTMEVPCKSIKSEKGGIMDNKTYDALKADKNPNISYKLDKITGLNKKTNYDINASGNLTIAGTTKKIDMYVQGKVGSEGSITFSGSKKIRMTDFGIKPPTALMGTMTVGDEVEIVFSVTLKQ